MTTRQDYYATLGVSKTATEKEIKAAYRKLAKKYHPDTNPGNEQAKKRFQEITEAYNILSDKEKRKNYDQYGDPDGNPFAGQGGNPFGDFGSHGHAYRSPDGTTYYYSTSGGPGFEHAGFGAEDFEDMFGSLFGHMGGQRSHTDPFQGRTYRSTQSSYQNTASNSYDINAVVSVPFVTAALGGEVRLNRRSDTLMLKIPAGTQCGARIRLKGKGAPIPGRPGQYGDLYVEVRIQVPKNLTTEQKEKLRAFADAN